MSMKKFAHAAALVAFCCILSPGCGGGAENSVAAPPEKVPTAEELAASYEAQAKDYQQQQREMQQRDSSR
ncbi:hypothetical protein RBWH47_05401 [Rhodopirellula baltica WH47]|uniref:Secreted protein n=2 Tax=Rhodopirellula baltica TaxID=265606 RepID=F2AKZ7_RHOBT|nr:hypothetical protein RBWH47_05401 [Rhodopirellula baltica WH47]